jgi:hypothetical protein
VSIEIVLIPLAFAAVSAWQAKRAGTATSPDGVVMCDVETRMKDPILLQRALEDLGATAHFDSVAVDANWADVTARFTRGDDGIWSAHLSGNVDVQRATGIIGAVDQAYGRQVQAAVLARIRAHSAESGLTLKSESVGQDKSVTMILEVNQVGTI